MALGVFFLALFISTAWSHSTEDVMPCEEDTTTNVRSSDMTLEFVTLLTRHGDRTPVHTLPSEPYEWICPFAELSTPDDEASPVPKSVGQRLYRTEIIRDSSALRGNCSLGQLTDIGVAQHKELGRRLRRRYIEELEFLPNVLRAGSHDMYVRSTNIPRTIQSAQSMLLGMYPVDKRMSNPVVPIHIRDAFSEDLYPPTQGCPRFLQLLDEATRTPEWVKRAKQMEPLKKKLEEILNIEDLEWLDIYDSFFCRWSHGIPLPEGVTHDMMEQVFDEAGWEITFVSQIPKLARLLTGRVVRLVRDQLDAALAHRLPYRFLFLSAHDTTVGPFAQALGFAVPYSYPTYATDVEIELWRAANGRGYVRSLYRGEERVIPGCATVFCPLEVFKEIAEPIIPSEDWDQECRAVGDVPHANGLIRRMQAAF